MTAVVDAGCRLLSAEGVVWSRGLMANGLTRGDAFTMVG
jgi:hypothetical protein